MVLKSNSIYFGRVLCILLTLSFIACGSSPPPKPPRQYEVSVKQDGKPVETFSESLVHRVGVTKAEIMEIFGPAPEHMNLPFALKPKADLRGGIVGFEVVETFESRSRLDRGMSSLGLRIGDLITAVGKMRIGHEEDFWHIYDLLKLNQQATLTIEREGRPHKFLYFLKDT